MFFRPLSLSLLSSKGIGLPSFSPCLLLSRPFASPSSSSSPPSSGPSFRYQNIFSLDPSYKDPTPYRLLSKDHVKVETIGSHKILHVAPEGLELLSEHAMIDIAHLLRPAHLQSLSNILKDSESSPNDRFVALELLKNASIAANMILPGCQDTGTAIVMGKKGQTVFTNGKDEESLSKGIFNAYTKKNLRYSQVSPLSMFEEKNTGSNLPAQIDIFSTPYNNYQFQFIAKGGGSANKTYLFQQTKALLNEKSLEKFLDEKLKSLGTSACPPYHLALVIGGLTAEQTLKTVKLASTKYYDGLPTKGNQSGQAFRDLEWEEKILKMTQTMGVGAQFGGKYFCHDVRVIRLPRHGASCPVGLGVSCSADRQALGKINEEGIWLEELERNPDKYLPEVEEKSLSKEVKQINLNQPMKNILSELSQFPISTRLSLTGTLIVARDIAHAKLQERINAGKGLPQYIKDHIVYYAGPAKTPTGYASGSFGPTTAGRMDSYVDNFMKEGGSMISLAKGNRSKEVKKACKAHGGFYLGSIGGPAAILAKNCIKKVEVLEYPELGMEAIWKIEVENFPAFIVINNKGEDFFDKWGL